MNGLDVYNIINKVRQHLPKKYHRPYELVFDTQLLDSNFHEIVGFALPNNNNIIIHVPNLIKVCIKYNNVLCNGKTKYVLPVKNNRELLAYVYLHECGHLASKKQLNLTEPIADKFATFWFNKLKEKINV